MSVQGPDGEVTDATCTTDPEGRGTAQLSRPDGTVPGGTTLSAALTGPGGESVPGVEQSLTTPEDEVVPTPEPTEEPTPEPTTEPTAEPTAEPTPELTTEPTAEPTGGPTAEPTEEPTTEPVPDPISETTSTGDDPGSATNPWTIRYDHLTADVEYTVVVTGPDGQVTTATFRTDAEDTGSVELTWPDSAVPGATELTAAVSGSDGQPITAIGQTLTAAADEPTPTPTPEPTPSPTAEPTTETTEEPTAAPTPEPTEEPTPTPTTEPTEEPSPPPRSSGGVSSCRTPASRTDPWSSPAASSCWPVPVWWAGARCGVVADPEGPPRTRRTVSAEGRSTCGYRVLRPWARPCLLS